MFSRIIREINPLLLISDYYTVEEKCVLVRRLN